MRGKLEVSGKIVRATLGCKVRDLVEEFGDVLKRLMIRVGPPGSERSWTKEQLAKRMGVSEQAVKNWRTNKNSCTEIDKLANLLWSGYECDDRELLLRANSILKNPNDTLARFTSISTVQGFWERLKEIAGLELSDDFTFDAEGVSDAAWLVSQIYPAIPLETAKQYAWEARAYVNNVKYGESVDKANDERHIGGIDVWNGEIRGLFEKYGVVPRDQDLLVVGLGAGFEGVGIYDSFRSFVGTDISRTAIEKARGVFRTADSIQLTASPAEWLPQIARNKDVYVSLKTYQSSFFDIERASAECSNALKPGGLAIISIPRGYLVSNKRVFGLSRTVYDYHAARESGAYKLPDKQYVFELMSRIALALSRRLFTDIKIETGEYEYYLFARKVR